MHNEYFPLGSGVFDISHEYSSDPAASNSLAISVLSDKEESAINIRSKY